MKKTFVCILTIFSVSLVFSQSNMVDSLITQAEKASGIEQARLYNRASKIMLSHDPSASLSYSGKAMEMAKKMQDQQEIYNSLFLTGRANYYMGNFDRALEIYFRALDDYKNSLSKDDLLELYNSIGTVYSDMHNLEKSIEYYMKSIQITEKLIEESGDSTYVDSYAMSLMNLGILFHQMKNVSKAKENFQKALEVFYVRGDSTSRNVATILMNASIVYEMSGEHEKALNNFFKIIDISEKQALPPNYVAIAKQNICGAYMKNRKYELSLEYGLEALELLKALKMNHNYAQTLLSVGIAYLETGKPDRALEKLTEAKKIAEDQGYLSVLMASYDFLARYYEKIGNYKKAFETKSEMVPLYDSIYDAETTSRINEIETKYQTEKKEQEIELLEKNAKIQDLKIKRQQTFNYALAGIILLIVIAAVLGFGRVKEKQRRIKSELEKKNLETEQKLLRAQINPHFMFNALNSVQSYISANDNLKAMSFLAKFSQLMRNILENSRKSMVSLEDEIGTLELFMELEAMRFKDKFDFQINISSELIPAKIFIPPMLVQPFVENSIKHAFRSKDDKGKLTVDFNRDNGTINCVVEDNGVGREKTMTDKRNRNTSHVSLGMQVTRERLETIKKDRKTTAGFTITDLKKPDGEPCGTRVTVKMPYESE